MRKRLFNILNKIVNKQATIAKRGAVYKASGTVKAQYAKNTTICNISELPVGTYLILGYIGTSISNSSLTNAIIVSDSPNSELLSRANTKGSMESGGGIDCWAILKVNANFGAVRLYSYGYLNQDYNIDGVLTAILLDEGGTRLRDRFLNMVRGCAR